MPTTITLGTTEHPSFLPTHSPDWNIYLTSEFETNGNDLTATAFIDVPANTTVDVQPTVNVRFAQHNGNTELRDVNQNKVRVVDLTIPFISYNGPGSANRRNIEVLISLDGMANQNIGYVTFNKSGKPKKKAVSTNANVQPDKKK